MASTADLSSGQRAATQRDLLDGLRHRLESAEQLAREMRQGLVQGDAESIEAATARLETLALEYKVLADEYRRARVEPAASDARVEEGMRRLEETATRIARASAIAGGLLERMVGMSRTLLDSLDTGGPGYLPSGRAVDTQPRGLRLREQA